MRFTTKIWIAGIAAACSIGAASAADRTTIPLSTQRSLPVVQDAGFDWNGFYAGVYGVAQNSSAGGTQFGAGIEVGVNAQFDFYLLGAEVAVQGLTGDIGDTTYGQILGSAGLVVADNALVYAAGGYGIDLGAPAEQDVLLGGGIELAVTDSVTLNAEYLHAFPTQGDNSKDQFTLGAKFHF